MKPLILGSIIVAFSGGIILGYGWKGVELRSVSHWGCEAPEYIGPTGQNHSVEASEWRPYGRPERWWD